MRPPTIQLREGPCERAAYEKQKITWIEHDLHVICPDEKKSEKKSRANFITATLMKNRRKKKKIR